MKNVLVVVGWFVGSLLMMTASMSTIHFLRKTQKVEFASHHPVGINQGSVLAFQVQATDESLIDGTVRTEDARPILVANFLKEYRSPLQPYPYWGQFLTGLADKYQLDYRLLPSIGMQESNLCRKIPEGSHNCLGLGIHAKGTWGFDTYEANFEKAAEILKREYIDKGYVTPAAIQTKYTPHSNGSWAAAINHFMEELESGKY